MSVMHEFFSLQKQLSNPAANRFGLQVIRYIAFKAIHKYLLHRLNDDSAINHLQAHGYCVLTDFLPTSHFRAVRDDFNRAVDKLPIIEGDRVDVFGQHQRSQSLRSLDINRKPNVETNCDDYVSTFNYFLYHPRLRQLFANALGQTDDEFFLRNTFQAKFEKTIQTNPSDNFQRSEDSNAQFHSDTFHTIIKGYYLISPVDETNGAFRYIESSNNWSLRQLVRTYMDSNQSIPSGRQHYQTRYSDQDAQKYGKLTQLCYPSNTLILADTSGLHARGHFSPDTSRDIVYLDCRYNPFLGIRAIFRGLSNIRRHNNSENIH